MAKQATKDNVRAGPSEVQYKSALNIIKQDIERAKKAQSKAGGDANAAWKRIEGMGINKAGAKFFASIYGQEPAVAQDILRTVIQLATVEGLLDKDLVDQAEQGASDEPAQEAEGDLQPFVPQESKKRSRKPKSEAVEKGEGTVVNMQEALKRSRKRLGTEQPEPAKGPEGDTDLAGDDGEDGANAFLSTVGSTIPPVPDALH